MAHAPRPDRDPFRVGRIETIFRFPIKSVGGRTIDHAYVGEHGILGDRRYAFVDLETGKLCNAKNPRKYSGMLACHAYFVDEPRPGEPLPPLEVAFPDGSTHRNVGSDLDDAMSRHLGRRVRLTTEALKTDMVWVDDSGVFDPGVPNDYVTVNDEGEKILTYGPTQANTFFDMATLHFITTSTLRHFQGLDPTANFDPRRYRPTMVIDTTAPGLVEDDWVGGSLAMGDEFSARVDVCTSRCVMSTLAHDPNVPLDRRTLRTIAKHNAKVLPGFGRGLACAGVYAAVTATGAVRVGDSVCFRPTEPAGQPAADTAVVSTAQN